MERAQITVRLLRNTLAAERSPVAEALVTEGVLRVGDSLITYRRRMAAGVGSAIPAGEAVHLLATDETNPRSVVFSLRRLLEALAETYDPVIEGAVTAIINRLVTIDTDESFLSRRVALFDLMADVESDLRGVSELIEAAHFEQQPASRSFSVPEIRRLAMSDLHDKRQYRVLHKTAYTYDAPVTTSYGRGCLRPRPQHSQTLLEHTLVIDPVPQITDETRDLFGNFTHYLEIHTDHERFEVVKESVLDVEWPEVDLAALDGQSVADAAAALRQDTSLDPVEHALYTLPSAHVELSEEVRRFAGTAIPAGRPLGEAIDVALPPDLLRLHVRQGRDHRELDAAGAAGDEGRRLPGLRPPRRRLLPCGGTACPVRVGLHRDDSPARQAEARRLRRHARLGLGLHPRRLGRHRPHQRPPRRLPLHRDRLGPRLPRRLPTPWRHLHRSHQEQPVRRRRGHTAEPRSVGPTFAPWTRRSRSGWVPMSGVSCR
jgi:hypothetical protein